MPLMKRDMFPYLSGQMTRVLEGSSERRRVMMLSQSSLSRFFKQSTSPVYSARNVKSLIGPSASTVQLLSYTKCSNVCYISQGKIERRLDQIKLRDTLQAGRIQQQEEGILLVYAQLDIVPLSLNLLSKAPARIQNQEHSQEK